MKSEKLKEGVLDLLARTKQPAMSAGELAAALKVPGKAGKRIQKCLSQLVIAGDIVRIRGDRYALGAQADLFTGVMASLRSGNAFVKPADGSEEIFVAEQNVGTALPGDRVVVRLSPDRRAEAGRTGARREGRIIRILERGQREIVGTVRSTGHFFCVVPLDPVYQHDFYVKDAAGANVGDRVIIRFTEWANRHVNPEAEIVEVLGPEDHPSVDTVSVIRQFELHEAFPRPVLREAESVAGLVREPGPRLDLRDEYILTIDPARARDFDDALSLRRDEQGRRELGVHIADVAHFVRVGSDLDNEAKERGNSVYLPDKVLPMLPEQLSNGVCSLKPNEDRLAFSAFLTYDDSGRLVERRFAKSMIRSRARLTYETAFEVLKAKKPAASSRARGWPDAQGGALLRELNALAQQLRAGRFARFALDLDVPEVEIEMDAESRMTGIRVVENDISHQLVEECMVAANEAVAWELRDAGVPLISRIHEPPREDKIEELTVQLAELGYRPGNLHHRRNLAAFLKSVQDDPLAYDVRLAVLKSMNRAVYSAEPNEHFGLAKAAYAHFTSPIRRYPDLVVHRQLALWLGAGGGGVRRRVDVGGEGAPTASTSRRSVYSPDELAGLADHCSQTERTADDAERALTEIKKYRFLEAQLADRKPEAYEAIVVTVTNFGLFVEIPSIQVQGLVHVSQLSDRFLKFNRETRTLGSGKEVFKRGKRLTVRVSKVDFDSRRIDFVVCE